MNKSVEQVSEVVGQGLSAMVFQQVIEGIGFILVSLVLAVLIGVAVTKLKVNLSNGIVIIALLIMGLIAIVSFICGLLHVVNPEYWAILELKGFIK